MNTTISFDSLPKAVMELTEKVDFLITLLDAKLERRDETPKYLNTENALAYLKGVGFAISKSKLYKLTALNAIPVHKNGNTLLFIQEELDRWCERNIANTPGEYKSDILINTLFKARKKTNKNI